MVSHLLSVVNCDNKLNEKGSSGIRRAATARISRSVPCKSARERKFNLPLHSPSPSLLTSHLTFTFKLDLYRTTRYYKTTTDLVTCADRYHYRLLNLPYSILLISIIGVRSIHNPASDGGRAHHWPDTGCCTSEPPLAVFPRPLPHPPPPSLPASRLGRLATGICHQPTASAFPSFSRTPASLQFSERRHAPKHPPSHIIRSLILSLS
ncbi:hypothetical protein F4860DRAFT_238071 [Xylaria cubensis]|nr:hypothetical protein F4860DRAFT_238071 [Xylaria cubensis]